ncbi:MAG: AzlC family ABC transporter permease [Peptococcaceae bacterium]|nr:AzlC family ABC transporter permease [Peptococcaceae bacterium]
MSSERKTAQLHRKRATTIAASPHAPAFREGLRDGVPIGLGYFAVAFSLGIQAASIGLGPFQGFLLSALVNASAGEYAAMTVMAALGTYLEMFIITLVANARYMLMSASLSQRFSPETPFVHRLLVGFGITDELFGITIARPGAVDPFYSYGAFTVALPGWALGTVAGIIAGDVLPEILVGALSVALFGMFLAIIIPPARKDRIVGVLVAISFAASYAASKLPVTAALSEGTRTIILTLLIAGAAAVVCPIKPQQSEKEERQ